MDDERRHVDGVRVQDATATAKATKRKAAVALASQGETPGKKKRARKAGKLAMIFDMPIEIWFEIFRQLLPLDLLHLSRTSRQLCKTLLNPSNQCVWADALATVPGLPECPPEMTKPQWTHLVFDHHCNGCGAPRVRTADWVFRVRLCQRCCTEKLEKVDDYTPSMMMRMSEILPCRQINSQRRRIWVCRSQLTLLTSELDLVSDAEVRAAFVQERKEWVNKIKNHATMCQDWVAEQDRQRALNQDRIREARKLAIFAKLEEEGWSTEISSMSALETHRLTRQREFKKLKPLTDRTWQKTRRPLIEILEGIKAERLQKEEFQRRAREESEARRRLENKKARLTYVVDLLRGYKFTNQSSSDIIPGPPDFVELPPIKSTLEAQGPPIIDVQRMEHIVNNILPPLIENWRAGCIYQLMVHLTLSTPQEAGGHDVSLHHQYTLDRIKLATTIFRCRECLAPPPLGVTKIEYMFCTEALQHACLTKTHGNADADDTVHALNGQVGGARRQKWSPDKLILDLRAGEVAEIIVTMCGLDPATATLDDMDQTGARIICLDCTTTFSEDQAETWIMDWRIALRHQLTVHWHANSATPRLHVLPEHARDQVLRSESAMEQYREATVKEWCCLPCFGTPDENEPLCFPYLKVRHKHHWTNHDTTSSLGLSELKLPNANYCKYGQTKPNALLEDLYESRMSLKISRSWLPLALGGDVLEPLPASAQSD